MLNFEILKLLSPVYRNVRNQSLSLNLNAIKFNPNIKYINSPNPGNPSLK